LTWIPVVHAPSMCHPTASHNTLSAPCCNRRPELPSSSPSPVQATPRRAPPPTVPGLQPDRCCPKQGRGCRGQQQQRSGSRQERNTAQRVCSPALLCKGQRAGSRCGDVGMGRGQGGFQGGGGGQQQQCSGGRQERNTAQRVCSPLTYARARGQEQVRNFGGLDKLISC
jgi:hypothetical protein